MDLVLIILNFSPNVVAGYALLSSTVFRSCFLENPRFGIFSLPRFSHDIKAAYLVLELQLSLSRNEGITTERLFSRPHLALKFSNFL